MLSLLRSHTKNFPGRPHTLYDRAMEGGVMLLTGTTGGSRSNILGQLSLDPSVKKIHALNRRSPRETLFSRQLKAPQQMGIPQEGSLSPKVQLVEADLSQPHLGLNSAIYSEVYFRDHKAKMICCPLILRRKE